METCLVVLELAADLLADDRHFADVALIDVGKELGEVDLAFFGARAASLDNLPQQDARQHDDQPEHDRFNRRIH